MWEKVKAFVTEGWKAVVALAVPVLIGALATIVDGFGQWITDQGYAWAGIGVGVLTSISVWLKANAKPA